MAPFVDRKSEISELNELLKGRQGQLIIVHGRRRVGKTRLLLEWAKESVHPFIYWVARRESPQATRASLASALWQNFYPGRSSSEIPIYESWSLLFEETARMVESLEGIENVAAVELGFAPQLSDDIIFLTVEMALGELPLIVNLPIEQILSLGPHVITEGAAAVSVGTPRGMIPSENGEQVTGRLNGAGLFPGSMLVVRDAAREGIPVIGAGGVQSKQNADAMLSVGALAVQVDASLWKGDVNAWVPES